MLSSIVNKTYFHEENVYKFYYLKEDCINIIDFDQGDLIFPKLDRLCMIQLAFVNAGEFNLVCDGKDHFCREKFLLGTKYYKKISTCPGTPGFDCQPSFMYIHKKNKWFVLSQGQFVIDEGEACLSSAILKKEKTPKNWWSRIFF